MRYLIVFLLVSCQLSCAHNKSNSNRAVAQADDANRAACDLSIEVINKKSIIGYGYFGDTSLPELTKTKTGFSLESYPLKNTNYTLTIDLEKNSDGAGYNGEMKIELAGQEIFKSQTTNYNYPYSNHKRTINVSAWGGNTDYLNKAQDYKQFNLRPELLTIVEEIIEKHGINYQSLQRNLLSWYMDSLPKSSLPSKMTMLSGDLNCTVINDQP